jgi:hypothetical protein
MIDVSLVPEVWERRLARRRPRLRHREAERFAAIVDMRATERDAARPNPTGQLRPDGETLVRRKRGTGGNGTERSIQKRDRRSGR